MAPTDPSPEDRLAPGRRPARRPVMYQSWRDLLFLHWPFPPETVAPLLPPGLDLDTFDGRAYVGLVPFYMTGVRPAYLPPVPWLSHFSETNVRTYVHRQGRDPGVWFFSLDAANPVAVALGRSLFGLPYHNARMSLERGPGSGAIRYRSVRRRPGLSAITNIQCQPEGPVGPTTPGTLDHFLVERYLLYAERRGRLMSGQVHHPPYLAQGAGVTACAETLLAELGLERPAVQPLVHYVRGVDVEIFSLRPVTPPEP